MFVSCNPTLTSFIQKNPYPKVFSALPTPNQRKTCIKHTFLNKKIMQKKFIYPIFFGPLQETCFSWPNEQYRKNIFYWISEAVFLMTIFLSGKWYLCLPCWENEKIWSIGITIFIESLKLFSCQSFYQENDIYVSHAGRMKRYEV